MTVQPTEHGIDVAAAALGKASLFDTTIRGGDPMVIAAWAQALDDLDADEAVAAVDKFYAQPNPNRLVPGALLAIAREKRRDDAMRGVLRRREIEAPRDPEASHRGYLEARQALADALPDQEDPPDLTAACPWCKAGPGEPCTNNGATRSSNHPSRETGVLA